MLIRCQRIREEVGISDGSVAPSLIESNQAAVFNNCGELIGLLDKSVRSKVSTIKGLDDLTSAAVSTGRYTLSEDQCPSEEEKRLCA